jgi:hypothetical protein
MSDVPNTDTTSTDIIDPFSAPIQAVATAADSQVAAAVSTLTLIQQSRLSNQSRAATLAVAVYGAGSSQATAAKKIVTATTTTAARLAVLTQQVSTPAPTVAAAGWVLHGRVYTSDLSPQSGYAVFLVDAQKNYFSDSSYSYTDDTGYFLLSSDGSSSQPSGAQSGESQTGESQSAAPTPAPSATPQLYIQITDAKANPVLLSETAFVPVTGKAAYQAVTLPPGHKKLGNLPADIRAVALPDLKSAPKQKAAKSAAPKTDKTT